MSHVVFVVTHPFLGGRTGADLATLQLARQLQARGHRCAIELLFMDHDEALSAWRARRGVDGDVFELGGVPARVRRIAIPASSSPPEIAARCWRRVEAALAAMVDARGPDVVVVPWGPPRLAQAARAHHARVVLLVQNPDAIGALTPAATDGLALATVSDELARRIRDRAGRTPLVILNPIERDGVEAIDGPHDRIGMVNLSPAKGAVIFLNAAANLPGARFVATPGAAADPGLPNVEITRPLDRMAELYAQLRVLLVPSLAPEAFARVVIEAQLSGIPVVCTSRCPARAWAGDFVVPVAGRASDARSYQDAALHRATIRGFLDALVTLDDPANHALASAQARDAARRYEAAQLASILRFEHWLA